jgi:hypothetical protein
MANDQLPLVPSEKIKIKPGTHREASTPALTYAKMMLSEMHDGEVWDLAERLDAAMQQVVVRYIEEIRR